MFIGLKMLNFYIFLLFLALNGDILVAMFKSDFEQLNLVVLSNKSIQQVFYRINHRLIFVSSESCCLKGIKFQLTCDKIDSLF